LQSAGTGIPGNLGLPPAIAAVRNPQSRMAQRLRGGFDPTPYRGACFRQSACEGALIGTRPCTASCAYAARVVEGAQVHAFCLRKSIHRRFIYKEDTRTHTHTHGTDPRVGVALGVGSLRGHSQRRFTSRAHKERNTALIYPNTGARANNTLHVTRPPDRGAC